MDMGWVQKNNCTSNIREITTWTFSVIDTMTYAFEMQNGYNWFRINLRSLLLGNLHRYCV